MFLCPICNVENRQNAKFCRRCGRTRQELEEAVQAQPENAHVSVKEVPVPISAVIASFEEQEPVDPNDDAAPQCPQCWAKLRLTDKYCYGCGEPQPARNVSHLSACRGCQSILPAGANFCFSCGAEVAASRRHVRTPVELFADENSEFFPRFEA